MKDSLQPVRPPLPRLAETEPSTSLRFVAGYFTLTGALGVVGLTVGGLAAAYGWSAPLRTVYTEHPISVALSLVTALTSVWAGRLLSFGDRTGARLALPMLLLPLAARLLGQNVSATTVVVSVVGLVVIAGSWRELR